MKKIFGSSQQQQPRRKDPLSDKRTSSDSRFQNQFGVAAAAMNQTSTSLGPQPTYMDFEYKQRGVKQSSPTKKKMPSTYTQKVPPARGPNIEVMANNGGQRKNTNNASFLAESSSPSKHDQVLQAQQ